MHTNNNNKPLFRNSFFDDDDDYTNKHNTNTITIGTAKGTAMTSSNKIIFNPYAHTSSSTGNAAAAAAAAAREDSTRKNYSISTIPTATATNKNSTTTTATMGKQSQFRNGSVKRSMKRATKIGNTKAKKFARSNLVQRSMDGGEGFVPHLHCKQCVAIDKVKKGLIATAPHRPHDWRCWNNKRKNAGLSTFSRMIEREAAKNLQINNSPLVPLVERPKWNPVSNPGRVFPLFVGTTPPSTRTTTDDIMTDDMTENASNLIVQQKDLASAKSIKAGIDDRLTTNKIFCKSKVSKQLGAAIDYILGCFAH
jgi:hypothetical protein